MKGVCHSFGELRENLARWNSFRPSRFASVYGKDQLDAFSFLCNPTVKGNHMKGHWDDFFFASMLPITSENNKSEPERALAGLKKEKITSGAAKCLTLTSSYQSFHRTQSACTLWIQLWWIRSRVGRLWRNHRSMRANFLCKREVWVSVFGFAHCDLWARRRRRRRGRKPERLFNRTDLIRLEFFSYSIKLFHCCFIEFELVSTLWQHLSICCLKETSALR